MNDKDYDKRIITIPNALTTFRLVLIPLFAWRYFSADYVWATLIVAISGVTDVVDGIVARRFGMVSALGKALDPIADKLTQICVMFCLVKAYPNIWIPLLMLIIKEVLNGVLGLMIVTRTGTTYSAEWHGKVATVAIYLMTIIHILWSDVNVVVSTVSIILTAALMITSFVLYAIRNLRTLRGLKREESSGENE